MNKNVVCTQKKKKKVAVAMWRFLSFPRQMKQYVAIWRDVIGSEIPDYGHNIIGSKENRNVKRKRAFLHFFKQMLKT